MRDLCRLFQSQSAGYNDAFDMMREDGPDPDMDNMHIDEMEANDEDAAGRGL